ncbi:MAG: CsbD family protein [Nocardia sp.]|nr:CsbD family protein [Nocardia sp.]
MSVADKFSNTADDLGGKAKEAAGAATGDEQLRAEGKADQLEAGVKRAVADVKSTVGDAVDAVKQKFGK